MVIMMCSALIGWLGHKIDCMHTGLHLPKPYLVHVQPDHGVAVLVVLVRDAGLRDVDGYAVLAGLHDGLVQPLRVDGVEHLGHDFAGEGGGGAGPVQHRAAVVVEAPPVARRAALGLLEG